jgi:hypothetical protein
MTFFDSFFKMPWARRRHNRAPLLAQRVKFLQHQLDIGRKSVNVQQAACLLLQVNRTLKLTRHMRSVTHEEINQSARKWEKYSGPHSVRSPGNHNYDLCRRLARAWLRFNGCLIEPKKTRLSERRLRDFEKHLCEVVGLAGSTVETRTRHALYFLMWLQEFGVKLPNVTLSHVERYLESKQKSGRAITTQILGLSSIRMFLRYTESQGWSREGIYVAVPRFLKPKYLFTQKGPSWSDVGRMTASLNRHDPMEIHFDAFHTSVAIGCDGSLAFGDQEPYSERSKVGSGESIGQRYFRADEVLCLAAYFSRNPHLETVVYGTVGGRLSVVTEQKLRRGHAHPRGDANRSIM